MAVGLPKDSFLIVTEIDGPAVLVDARAQSVADLLTSAGASSVESVMMRRRGRNFGEPAKWLGIDGADEP